MSSLWNLRSIELFFGSLFYLKYSFFLLIFSVVLIIGIYHILIHYFHKENYIHVIAVGYSCVVFGWMTIAAQITSNSDLSLFGFNIPMSVAPFGSLILTSILVPRASFVGHLAGILIGYIIAIAEHFQVSLFPDYMFFHSIIWISIGFAINLKSTTNIQIPYFQAQSEMAPRSILQNGILIRVE